MMAEGRDLKAYGSGRQSGAEWVVPFSSGNLSALSRLAFHRDKALSPPTLLPYT
jgi:hypothetical protein